jgi:hypothetical protein
MVGTIRFVFCVLQLEWSLATAITSLNDRSLVVAATHHPRQTNVLLFQRNETRVNHRLMTLHHLDAMESNLQLMRKFVGMVATTIDPFGKLLLFLVEMRQVGVDTVHGSCEGLHSLNLLHLELVKLY